MVISKSFSKLSFFTVFMITKSGLYCSIYLVLSPSKESA